MERPSAALLDRTFLSSLRVAVLHSRMPSLVRSLQPHLIAIAAVAVAAAAHYLLNRVLPPGAVPFITFFPAVVLASWYGGLWPGVTAAVAAYLAADWCRCRPMAWRLLMAMTRR